MFQCRISIGGNVSLRDKELFGGLQPETRSLLGTRVGRVDDPPLQLQPAGQMNGGAELAHPIHLVQNGDQ